MIRARIQLIAALTALVFFATPMCAQAWWNSDFKQRTVVTLNTSAAGVTTPEAGSAKGVIALDGGNVSGCAKTVFQVNTQRVFVVIRAT